MRQHGKSRDHHGDTEARRKQDLKFMLIEEQLTEQIIGAAIEVHRELGPGLLESVYEAVMAHELRKKGLIVERQKPMPIIYDGVRFEEAFRADLLVDGKVIAELKSVESLSALHAKQVLTQLRMTDLKLGLLINFGEAHLKNGIKRIINGKLEDQNSADISL